MSSRKYMKEHVSLSLSGFSHTVDFMLTMDGMEGKDGLFGPALVHVQNGHDGDASAHLTRRDVIALRTWCDDLLAKVTDDDPANLSDAEWAAENPS